MTRKFKMFSNYSFQRTVFPIEMLPPAATIAARNAGFPGYLDEDFDSDDDPGFGSGIEDDEEYICKQTGRQLVIPNVVDDVEWREKPTDAFKIKHQNADEHEKKILREGFFRDSESDTLR